MKKQDTHLRRIHALFRVGTYAGLSDGQLLERFVSRNGEAAELAFAVLVERHGPMVFRVCRCVLRDSNDAHDAFQATFLVLVRKARAIRNRESLGSWLYGVALRVASCTRSAAARRRIHERRLETRGVDMPFEDDQRDLVAAVHEEVGRLPERFKMPVVFCYLEGMTQEEAAARLGWPLGTVRSRLARARERLRGRLARRGLAPSGVAVAALLSADRAEAAVPADLVETTIRIAMRWMTSQAMTAGAVPATVAALSGGALRIMLMSKLKTITAAILVVAALTAGAGVLAQQDAASAVANQQAREPHDPNFKPAGEPARHSQTTDSNEAAAAIALLTADKPGDDDAPTEAEVFKKLIENRFKNLRMTFEKVESEIQGCKVYPLVGPAQTIKNRYKCTVHFDELHADRLEREVNVVYVDKVRLLRCDQPGHSHSTGNDRVAAELALVVEQLEHAEKLFKRGYISKAQVQIERAKLEARRASALPTAEPARSSAAPLPRLFSAGNAQPPADQERRLQDVEHKLDQILKALDDVKGAPRGNILDAPGGTGR